MPTDSSLESHLRLYANELRDAFTRHINVSAWPEEQLKAPVSKLLVGAGDALNRKPLRVIPEVSAEEHGRPDLGVTVAGLLTGHVELKQPGRGANPAKFQGREKVQWQRFKNLPNLLYTDGLEFAHFKFGQRVGTVVRLSCTPTSGAESIAGTDATKLLELFRGFLSWRPIVPKRPKALAEMLAPVCRLLREEVQAALEDPASPLSRIAADWRRVFFPTATDLGFADSYAQTLTYALLLARFAGTQDLSTEGAVTAIRPGHRLLAETLRVLGDPRAREKVATSLNVLERLLGAVDPQVLEQQQAFFARDGEGDPWLYFYEDFLAAYDRAMRKKRGVYFTPWQVVQAQIRITAQLLDERFEEPDTFASPEVVTLDPACGTGTYILAAVRHALDRVAERRGEGARATAATRAAKGAHAFEVLVGPYAVAHLRLTQQITSNGGRLPADGAHVYLADTLESPYELPPGDLPFALQELSEEHERAQAVKRDVAVLVCIGNPPYDREQQEEGETREARKGGWVRHGHGSHPPLLAAFVDPLEASGDILHAKNLYNDYVYFWRWALWKVYGQQQDHGIVSFITASSYLRGPGFKGMRQVMRDVFDELWIIDLGGDNKGARKSPNVFDIQTPVCIATGIRHPEGHPRRQADGTPAKVRFARFEGTEREKLDALGRIEGLGDIQWTDCPTDWMAVFLPAQAETFARWPLLSDLLPWQESGLSYFRQWPIAADKATLDKRWRALLTGPDRAEAFNESRDRKIEKVYPRLDGSGLRYTESVAQLSDDAPPPPKVRIAFRSFDRRWALMDGRVGDYLRPGLQAAHGPKQLYLTSIGLSLVLSYGPSAIATNLLTDYHHFSNRGGKHIVPLWRNAEATEANVTTGLLQTVEERLDRSVDAEDLFAYCYAILSAPDYVTRFWEALDTPGLRIPITTDPDLFGEAADLGRTLLWLHTYGDRYVPEGSRSGSHGLPRGRASIRRATSVETRFYPADWSYDPELEILRIGEGAEGGVVEGVSPAIMDFTISGFNPVKSWLSYRMKGGAGKKSSPLDDLGAANWDFDDELLDMLWVVEATLHRYDQANLLLEKVVVGDTLGASELPMPTASDRRALVDDDETDPDQYAVGL
jgi:hypothetical protein